MSGPELLITATLAKQLRAGVDDHKAFCGPSPSAGPRQVFQGVSGDKLRTALRRACTASGVPTFRPHDLRHRRVSLLHLGGMPWARIGASVGHDDITTTSRVYTHVGADERLEWVGLLDGQ